LGEQHFMKPRRVTILGSTGSIGCNTLDVLTSLGEDFEVVGLAAGRRWRELAGQVQTWRPGHVAIGDESSAQALQAEVGDRTTVLHGTQGLIDVIERSECDIVLSAIVGTAGLMATVKAVEMGKRIAIANKETLVVAGPLIKALARRSGSELIPVDSEHSAIFQAMHSGRHEELHRIYLTSSGGPFRTWTREQMRSAGLEDALAHPVWDMGPKITIDSATMMNKALEIVEARWLFDVECSKIDVLIHPQAVVHSMVEFRDGCLIAQLGTPDMRIPIQYALTYPHRRPASGEPLDVRAIRELKFEPPDVERFPALRLGYEVAQRGGSAGAVLNAANEAAVDAYRGGQISFGEITELAVDTLSRHSWSASPSLDELLEIDAWARNEVSACLKC